MEDRFILCPTCHRKFANGVSFDAHRAHGRCVDPATLGQHQMLGIFWIAGSALQVNPWEDEIETGDAARA